MCSLDAVGVSSVLKSVNTQMPTATSQMYTLFILRVLLVKILMNMEYEKTEFISRKAK